MALFSERLGYIVKPLQLETMSIALKNRIWNVYSCEVSDDITFYNPHYIQEIRHGGMDFKNAPAEDAKYMLVSCSAFVNYLIEKWSK